MCDMPLRDRLDHYRDWFQAVTRELAVLPETLSNLRDGAENFQRVAQRLDELTAPGTLNELRDGVENFRRVTQRIDEATGAMEQYSTIPSMGEMLQKAHEANRSFREQIASMPGGDRMASAMEDLSETLTAMGRLMPFWARYPSRDRSTRDNP